MEYIQKLFLDKELIAKSVAMSQIKGGGGVEESQQASASIGSFYTLKTDHACLVGPDVMSDIEIVDVFKSLDGCSLDGSRGFLKDVLLHPCCDKHLLKRRQAAVTGLGQDNIIEKAESLISAMSAHEADMLWMFKTQNDELSMLIEMIYFKFIMLKPLNAHDQALTALNLYKIVVSPLVGILSPVVYFIIPFMVMRIKFGIKVNFMTYIKSMMNMVLNGGGSGGNNMFSSKLSYVSFAFSFIFYFQSLFNNIEVAKVVYNASEYITNKMVSVVKFVKSASALVKLMEKVDVSAFIESPETKYDPAEAEPFENLSTNSFSPISNFGVYLKAFKGFDKVRYKALLSRVYILDALASIYKMKRDHGLSEVRYLESEQPRVDLKSIWHPCLSSVVKNDLVFDKSIIITGPNAGGKSTMIKSILIAVILAQTIGFANAGDIGMTPFYYISSQMNIPDCKGKESLFEAEMFRSKRHLDVLKSLEKSQKSVIFMDEIFNSTNPVEGIAGAFAIAKNMAKYENNLSIITTHYLYLTKLSKNNFKNIKMNIKYTESGDIIYPYKLTKGVSKQFIAIEILQKHGFDENIVKDALEIKESLLIV